MKITPVLNDTIEKFQQALIKQEQQERLAMSSTNSEVLTKLNISVDSLPQKSQDLLHQACTAQASCEVDMLDSVTVSLYQCREMAEKLDDAYEILKLRQKNEELQAKMDANDRFLEQLRKDLELSRMSLAKQNPNPDSMQELCRQIKQKVASYKESCEKAETKFSKLPVPEHALPKALAALVKSLENLREETASLGQTADDISLAREARKTLNLLRR